MTARKDTATDRHLRAVIAASTRWSRTTSDDRREATAAARKGLRAKFAREVDPENRMTEADLERAIDNAMRAHMVGLALKKRNKRKPAA